MITHTVLKILTWIHGRLQSHKQNCKMNKKAVVNQADAFWQEPFAAASFISYGRFGQSVLCGDGQDVVVYEWQQNSSVP